MRAVIVYESMYGNTRQIAEAIREGLGADDDVRVVPVAEADPAMLHGADLLVTGGPTHAHSISWPSTRRSAADAAAKPDAGLTLEPGATGVGLREWLPTLGDVKIWAAAFDTRLDAPQVFTGRGSARIERRLRQHKAHLIAEPESFLVTKQNTLLPGELERARAWGQRLADLLAAHTAKP
jgi:hypothetical protein